MTPSPNGTTWPIASDTVYLPLPDRRALLGECDRALTRVSGNEHRPGDLAPPGTWQGIYLCEHRDRGGSRVLVATVRGERAGAPS